MSAAPIVIAVRCSFCSKQRAPYRVHRSASGQNICDVCLEWHFHALEFLGGAVPRGCQGCEKTWETMQAESPDVELAVGVFVVPKDGIYQMLCRACAAPYLPKRKDLYKATRFGREVLKI
jgi:hypothetical protein